MPKAPPRCQDMSAKKQTRKGRNSGENSGKQRPGIENILPHQFKPGQSGNPAGRPPTRGLVSALRAKVAERIQDGRTVEQALIDELVREALHGGRNKLAAIQTIFDRLEGRPKQQLDFNDITTRLRNRTNEELEHFALHGCFPGEVEDGVQHGGQ